MLSNNNIVFSRSGDFYNFFPTTATEVLDDDPIDISASSTNVSNIKYGVPFNNTLILFTDSEQFKLSSNQGILTPKSVNIDPTTKFDLDDLSQPIGLGSNVYFANKKGKFTSIREYYVQEDTLTNDASDITAHVPNYIYKDVLKIVGNTSSDNLFVLTEDNRNEIFVYKYYWNGNEKVQSAWNKWTFEENILNIEIINNYLYIISEFKGEVFMSKINLEKETMYDLNFDYHLDYFTELEDITYNAGTNETTISVPYNINSIENFTDKYIIADNKGFNIGSSFNVLGVSEKDIIIQGDKTTLGTISIGRKFNMIHQFSRFSLKSQGTNVSEVEGRLQLTKINISYNNSIYFEVKIKPKGRSVSTKIFNNVKVGSSIFGTIESSDGNFKSYIMTNSDNEGIWLENSCHYPFGFQTISWEGQYTKRSQTV
ncbi:MAG: hypothetical protein U9Q38_08605 [Thermodesulfobacteriota bacterium]|nr:hypothetical protein [Thermodesulfobacteriota bacterium]